MKSSICLAVLGLLWTSTFAVAADQSSNHGGKTGSNSKMASDIIEKKCVSCHSKAKINLALSSGKDMIAIQKDMEKRGVKLNSNEREVLGIFWKQSIPTAK